MEEAQPEHSTDCNPLGNASQLKSLKDYDSEKMSEDILGILKNFETLGEINEQYGLIDTRREKT